MMHFEHYTGCFQLRNLGAFPGGRSLPVPDLYAEPLQELVCILLLCKVGTKQRSLNMGLLLLMFVTKVPSGILPFRPSGLRTNQHTHK